MVDFVRKNYSYQLGNTGKNQVGMQGIFVLGMSSCETEIIFDMLDISFNNSPDFIGIVPFLCSTKCTGISPEVFVIKENMTNDTQPVGDDSEHKGIAEMPIDIPLLNLRISTSMGRH